MEQECWLNQIHEMDKGESVFRGRHLPASINGRPFGIVPYLLVNAFPLSCEYFLGCLPMAINTPSRKRNLLTLDTSEFLPCVLKPLMFFFSCSQEWSMKAPQGDNYFREHIEVICSFHWFVNFIRSFIHSSIHFLYEILRPKIGKYFLFSSFVYPS